MNPAISSPALWDAVSSSTSTILQTGREIFQNEESGAADLGLITGAFLSLSSSYDARTHWRDMSTFKLTLDSPPPLFFFFLLLLLCTHACTLAKQKQQKSSAAYFLLCCTGAAVSER